MNNELHSRTNSHSGHVLDDLSAYLDGALGPGDLDRVRSHMEACAECRATYLDLSATRTMLRSMPSIPPPRAFTLTEEMVAVEKVKRAGFWQLFLSPRNAPRFATGSVLAFVLMVLVMVGNYSALHQAESKFVRIGSGLNDGGYTSSAQAPAYDVATSEAQGPERSGVPSGASGAEPPAAAMATTTTASQALSAAAPAVTVVTKEATAGPAETTSGGAAATSGQQTTAGEAQGTPVPQVAGLPAPTAAAQGAAGGQAQANDQSHEAPGGNPPLPQSAKVAAAPTPRDTGQTAVLGLEIALGVLGALFALGALLAFRRR